MRETKIARWLGAFALVGVMAVATACSGGAGGGDASASASDEPLQVFMSAGRTGLFAPQTAAVIRGAEAAIEHINGQGGINGRLIEIEFGDNQSDATRGVTLVQDAIAKNPPDLVIAGVSSTESLAVAPVLARNEIVGIAPATNAALADTKAFPYFWSQGTLQKNYFIGVAEFFAQRDVKKVAFVDADDALGDAISEALNSIVGASGVEVVEHRFKLDAVDMTPAFQAAVADEHDFIYMEATGTQVGSLMTSRAKAGAEVIPTIAGTTAGSMPLLEMTAGTNQMDNVYLLMLPTQYWIDPADRSDQFNAFFDTLMAQGPIELPLSVYAAGWDIISIWADAVGQVKGEVTPQAVRDELNNLSPTHDRLFYKNTYPKGENMVGGSLGEFIIAKPTAVKDGMFQFIDE